MNKMHVLSAICAVTFLALIGVVTFIYNIKLAENSPPIIASTPKNSEITTIATTTAVLTTESCDSYLVLEASSSAYNLPSLYFKCGKDEDPLEWFRYWTFGDQNNKKVFGLVYADIGSKCDCGGLISYFDYEKVYKDDKTFYLKKTDLIDSKVIYKNSSTSDFNLYAFDGFPYLLNVKMDRLDFIEPSSQEVYEGLRIGHNQTFCSNEMGCSPNISVSTSSQIISIDVFTYATGTQLFANEPIVVKMNIKAPH